MLEGWHTGDGAITRSEVNEMRKTFFNLIPSERVLVYFLTFYKDRSEVAKERIEHICGVIDKDLQKRDYYEPNHVSKLQFGVRGASSLERDVRNRLLENAYKKHLEGLNLDQVHNTFFNRSFVWYNNEQLCHYDCPAYLKYCDSLFVDLESGAVKKDAYVCYLGGGGDVVDSSDYNELSQVIVDNICTEIDRGCTHKTREQNDWSNNGRRSKLHIRYGIVTCGIDESRLPGDIVTVCANSYRGALGINGVVLGENIFPSGFHGFTYGLNRYSITTVENIFKKRPL